MERKERKRTRSDSYQQVFCEVVVAGEMLESFSNEESVYKRLNPFSYNEEIAILEDELKKEFWRIVDTLLTDRQRQVIRLYADGYTQMEIAKMLNVNQSSITKSLHGNVDYANNGRVYGGSKKKIKKIIEEDERIKEILRKISDLRDENWL
jgi:RNA polymerase sigma factor (sigma-70 family)